MPERKLLIWDFDGTLAYREGMWSGAMVEVLDRNEPGHGITRDDVRPHLRKAFPWHRAEIPHPEIGDPDSWWEHVQPVFMYAYSAAGFSESRAVELARHVRGSYTDPGAWSVYPDVWNTLSELERDGWTHVVLSNHVPELDGLMRVLGLRICFEAVYSSAVIGYEKPHPGAFRHVLQAAGSPRAVWMIGDNPVADIGGAAAAGIAGILVRSETTGGSNCCADLTGVRPLIGVSGRPSAIAVSENT